MGEIAAFAIAALILAGAGSFGRWNVGTIAKADAAAEAGLTPAEGPTISRGIDPFELMVKLGRDLPGRALAMA